MFKQDKNEKKSGEPVDTMLEKNGVTCDEACESSETILTPDTDVAENASALAAQEEPTEEPEEPADYLEARVLGMARIQFYGVIIGIGVGYILTGLLRLQSMWIPSIACIAVGYGISTLMLKKRKAAREAENQD